VFTFSSQPAHVMFGEKESFLLTTEEKLNLYEQCGVDVLIVYPVTKEFFAMEAEDFIADILVKKLGMKLLIGGSDLSFGRNRRGTAQLADELGKIYGYELRIIEKEPLSETIVSSTEIRKNILEGKMERANQLLGYPYFFSGKICHGKALGRTIGIPTINQELDEHKLVPPHGVYASETVIEEKTYISITNIGCKPTVGDNFAPAIETHLLDFDGDVYGKRALVRLFRFMRPEIKFSGIEGLKEQMQRDIAARRKMEGTNGKTDI